jgi:hypothetical protein
MCQQDSKYGRRAASLSMYVVIFNQAWNISVLRSQGADTVGSTTWFVVCDYMYCGKDSKFQVTELSLAGLRTGSDCY